MREQSDLVHLFITFTKRIVLATQPLTFGRDHGRSDTEAPRSSHVPSTSHCQCTHKAGGWQLQPAALEPSNGGQPQCACCYGMAACMQPLGTTQQLQGTECWGLSLRRSQPCTATVRTLLWTLLCYWTQRHRGATLRPCTLLHSWCCSSRSKVRTAAGARTMLTALWRRRCNEVQRRRG